MRDKTAPMFMSARHEFVSRKSTDASDDFLSQSRQSQRYIWASTMTVYRMSNPAYTHTWLITGWFGEREEEEDWMVSFGLCFT